MNSNLTLRTKLIYLTILLLVGFCLSLSVYLKTHFAQVLTDELLKRGSSITSHLAEVCANDLIEHDYLQLEATAKQHKLSEQDIVYILILNKNNKVVAHTFSGGYPLDLKEITHSVNGAKTSIQELNYGGQALYDIAAPVLDTRIGFVRVGISADPVNLAVNTMVGQILGVIITIGVLALLLALPVLKTILQPISALTSAVKDVATGKWDQTLPVSRNDEIGLLTESFNHMANSVVGAEKQLKSHAEFLQVLIDDIPIPVFYKNTKGVMLGCNYAYSDFWGKPKQAVVGEHTDRIYIKEDAALHLSKDLEVLEQGSPVSYEHSVVDAKGQSRQVVFNKAFYCDETGCLAGIIGVMQDVTDQRQADLMKNEFVSTVAHEFQTPLTTILGYVELIQGGFLQQNEHDDALTVITQKAESLSEMVDELLDLARIEAGKGLKVNLEPCHANEVLSEMISNFEKRTPNYQFSLNLPEKDQVVSADKVRMGQVMENLLSNAVKYSAEKSTIKVDVTNMDTCCQVQVADQGIGMTVKQKDKMFEKYYRVNTSNTAPAGTGLGLFITKLIIDAHSGQIDVDSTPGKGTTVMFRIPLHNV